MEATNGRAVRRTRTPNCTVFEDSGTVVVKVELPGVSKEGLEVKVEGNELSVIGEPMASASKGNYLVRERRDEIFKKLFTLDDRIVHDSIDAKLVDGILSLKLQVKEAAKPRRVEIA